MGAYINKIKSKKIMAFITLIIFAVIASIVIEVFVFNWNIIRLPKEQRIAVPIDLSILENNDFVYQDGILFGVNGDNKLEIDFNQTYINKFQVMYRATHDFETVLRTTEVGYYNLETMREEHSGNSFKLYMVSRNVNATVNGLEMEFTNSPGIEISGIVLNNTFSINRYRFVFIMGSILLFETLYLFKKQYFSKYENAFVIIALVIGMFMILFTPNTTLLAQDDETHFRRTYQFLDLNETGWSDSKNQMRIVRAFPYNSIQSREELGMQTEYLNVNDGDTVYTSTAPGKFSYSMIAYVHSSATLKIGEMLNLPFNIWFQLGKVSNLLVYVIVMFFAIKNMPVKKYLLFFFALLPTNLFLASSYSTDGIITSCLLLGFALFLKKWYSEEKVTMKWTAGYLLITAFGIFPKAVYAPIILLPLLFKDDKFENSRSRRKFKAGVIMIFLAIMATFVLPAILSPQVVGDPRGEGYTSMLGQLRLIFSYPLDFIVVMYKNAGLNFIDKMIGPETTVQMGYLGNLSNIIHYTVMFLLIGLTIINTKGEKLKVDKLKRWFILAVLFITIVLIWTALYLDFTAVGATFIQGVQGRYFLPILIPLLYVCTIPSLTTDIKERDMQTFVYLSCSIILLIGVYTNILSVYCF
jgi:Predicted membrane protein